MLLLDTELYLSFLLSVVVKRSRYDIYIFHCTFVYNILNIEIYFCMFAEHVLDILLSLLSHYDVDRETVVF